MTELLFPRTDAGVVVQMVGLVALLTAGFWVSRRHPELRLLVVGAGLILVALVGLRAAH